MLRHINNAVQQVKSTQIGTAINKHIGITSPLKVSHNLEKFMNAPDTEQVVDNFIENDVTKSTIGEARKNGEVVDILKTYTNAVDTLQKTHGLNISEHSKLTFITCKLKYELSVNSLFSRGNDVEYENTVKLAECYEKGIGVTQNFAKAKDLFDKAQYCLNILQDNLNKLDDDPTNRYTLLQMKKDNCDKSIEASNDVNNYIKEANAHISNKNLELALNSLTKAHNTAEKHNLQNADALKVKTLEISVALGSSSARNSLAIYYENGKGVTQDLAYANKLRSNMKLDINISTL